VKHKLEKSKVRQAGRYFYRGVYIEKSFVGTSWYARAREAHVKIPQGLSARTLGLLQILIDRALDGSK